MDIDDLIERLMGKGEKYDFNVIPARYKDKIFNEIMSWYKDQNISNEIIEGILNLLKKILVIKSPSKGEIK